VPVPASRHAHKYYLRKVPVESVRPGFCLAIRHDGDDGLFRECAQMSRRSGQPVMFTRTSEPVDGRDPSVLENQAGRTVVRVLGVCQAAS
jgi:hypothetical protein